MSLEAPDSDKLEISGTDDQLLLCYIFQVCMFFIEKGLHKKITVSVGHIRSDCFGCICFYWKTG